MQAEIMTDPGAPAAAGVLSPSVQRRNMLALMGDYVLFGLALNILNPAGLPPDFVAQLGGGPILVGLAGLLWRVTWLTPQLSIAAWVNRAPRKKRFLMVPATIGRLIFIPAALAMVLLGPDQPGLLIAVLLGSVVWLAIGDGSCVVAWMDILGSSLSSERRSTLIAASQVISGLLAAVLIAPAVRFILGPEGPTFPNNYAALWLLVGGLLLAALFSLSRVREGHSPPPKDSPGLRDYWRFLSRILREDRAFRNYLIMRFIYDLSAIGLPFYIVFATTQLGQESAVALSDQILLLTLTGTGAALLLGRVNARRGPRDVMVIATLAGVLSPLLILSSSAVGIIGLHLMWIVQAFTNAAFVPGFLNYVVEYAPEGYRPIYSGLANTFGALALLAPLLGGVIVDLFSYQALFGVGIVLGAIALLLALRMPRVRGRAAA